MEALKSTELDDLKWRTLIVTDEGVLLSDKKYKPYELYKIKLDRENEGEKREEYKYGEIIEANYLMGGKNIQLKKEQLGGKFLKENLDVEDETVIDLIVEKLKESGAFREEEGEVNKLRLMQKPLLSLGVAMFFVYLLYQATIELTNGGEISISGRKSGMKKILIAIAEFLGTTGVLIVGGLLLGGIGYHCIKIYKNPPSSIRLVRMKS